MITSNFRQPVCKTPGPLVISTSSSPSFTEVLTRAAISSPRVTTLNPTPEPPASNRQWLPVRSSTCIQKLTCPDAASSACSNFGPRNASEPSRTNARRIAGNEGSFTGIGIRTPP